MAYNFIPSPISYLSGVAPISSKPLTLACWFRRPTGTNGAAIVLFDQFNPTRRMGISLGSAGTVAVVEFDTALASVTTTTTHTSNTWNHACCTFTSNTVREPYLNAGGNRIAAGNVGVTGLTHMYIGANQVVASSMNGDIAEVGIWNVPLTQPEISSLAKGVVCDKVRPQNLIFYNPLIRNIQDIKGGNIITPINAPTIANHPRIYT